MSDNDQKITIKTDGKYLKFTIYDILEALDEDGRKELISYLACEDAVWEEFVRQLAEEYATSNYDARIHKLRQAFLLSRHFPDNVNRLVKSQLDEIAWLTKRLSAVEHNLYRWHQFYWDRVCGDRFAALPFEELPWPNRTSLQENPIYEFIASQGIDLAFLQEQEEDNAR